MSEFFTHSPLPEKRGEPTEVSPAADSPLVPPPPKESMEVVIRTMGSDMELMARGGAGTVPTPMTVSVSPPSAPSSSPSLKVAIWTAGVILAGGLIFAAGYILMPYIFPESEPVPQSPANLPSSPLPETAQEPARTAFSHLSFFRSVPSDKVRIEISEGFTRGDYEEALAAAYAGVSASSTFAEIEIRMTGQAAAWNEFVEAADIVSPEADFWSSRFEDDFTMFVFRDAKGYWPGYILKRRDGESALLVKNAMRNLEADPAALKNFFITDPVAPTSTFADIQIGGQPFRELNFRNPSAKFIYGWIYNNYFIISTSDAGFRRALEQF